MANFYDKNLGGFIGGIDPGRSGIFTLSNIPQIITVGEATYTTPGTYSWTVPDYVTSVCVVTIGGGAGGQSGRGTAGAGGGALAYVNNISVTPGESLTVIAGAGGAPDSPGGFSRLARGALVLCEAGGGLIEDTGGGAVVVGTGGAGGTGGKSAAGGRSGGGAGAGGYSGNGGEGGSANGTTQLATNGTGGGGGGGGGGDTYAGGGGGGTGLYGEGANGSAGTYDDLNTRGGGGGSGGTAGTVTVNTNGGNGGFYGGGGGGSGDSGGSGGSGGDGAVRIIWGENRAFPSTNVTLTIAGISYISESYNDAASGTLSIDAPTGTTNGDLLIAVVTGGQNAVTWAGPSGWTELVDENASPNLAVYYKVASSEPASWAWTNSSGAINQAGAVFCFRNATYGTIGSFGSVQTTSGTTAAPGITMPSLGINLAIFGSNNGSNFTIPSGYQQLLMFNSAQNPVIGVFAKSASGTTSSVDSTWTESAANGNAVGIQLGII